MADSPGTKCLRCQGDMQEIGEVSLVTGKHSAAAKLLFGQLAEMDERPWALSAHRCSSCHLVELYDPAP